MRKTAGTGGDWTAGYVVDMPYTAGYHRELSPSFQQYVLLQQGISPPHEPDGGFDYFEMGIGRGFSLNVHALTHLLGRFWGNDFNPEHVNFAQSLAEASGAPLRLFEDSFEDLLKRDLPDFDYISLHGVWSWISEGNRLAIVEFLRRKLKVGGVAMVSYNALPGLASSMPLRHLMSHHERHSRGSGSPLDGRISEALGFAQTLRDGGAHYFRINANVSGLLTSLESQNPQYLAHEYFNRDWAPMYFSEVAACLTEAGLAFAGSVSPFGCLPELALTPEMNSVVKGIDSMEFREDVRDFMLNTKFRRDLFVRGARRLSVEESLRIVGAMRFALIDPPKSPGGTITVGMREIALQKEIYEPLIAILGGCEGGLSVTELQSHDVIGKLPPGVLNQSLSVLLGMDCVAIHSGDAAPPENVKSLNRHIADRAVEGSPVAHLVSSIAGAAIRADRFEQLFLREAGRGADAEQAAIAVSKILKSRGETIELDGWPLVEEVDFINELRDRAGRFYRDRLPLFRKLAVGL